jgi:hypothetical protein
MGSKDKEMDRMNKYKLVFSTPEGKAVLKDLMLRYFMVSGTYNSDSNKMYFNEGARSVVADILEIINTDPHAYAKFLEEINDEAQVY